MSVVVGIFEPIDDSSTHHDAVIRFKSEYGVVNMDFGQRKGSGRGWDEDDGTDAGRGALRRHRRREFLINHA